MRHTKKDTINILQMRLSQDHLFNNTSIFKHMIGAEDPYDERTVNQIKLKIELWLSSWIRPELDNLIPKPRKSK